MLGHVSGAYAAKISRDLSVCSRFDFNVYSYESEWAMGAEWWMRRSRRAEPNGADDNSDQLPPPSNSSTAPPPWNEVHGVVKARASTSNVSALPFPPKNMKSNPIVLFLGCFLDVGRPAAQHAR
jgi:mitochondrial distribution and morphology protein 10